MTRPHLGIAYPYLGDYDQAIDVLIRTIVSLEGDLLYERFGLPTVPSVSARAWLAHYLVELGDFTQSIARGEETVRLAEALRMRPIQAHCHLGLGMLYAQLDRQEQAHAELFAAIELYRAMDMTFWLPQAEAAMASLRGGAG